MAVKVSFEEPQALQQVTFIRAVFDVCDALRFIQTSRLYIHE